MNAKTRRKKTPRKKSINDPSFFLCIFFLGVLASRRSIVLVTWQDHDHPTARFKMSRLNKHQHALTDPPAVDVADDRAPLIAIVDPHPLHDVPGHRGNPRALNARLLYKFGIDRIHPRRQLPMEL